MAGRKAGRLRKEREVALLAEPGTLDDLCEFITMAGTLQEWCRKHDVSYVRVHAWLHDVDHSDRLERYTLSLEGRDSFMGDMLKAGLRDIAMADIRRLYGKDGKMLAPHKLPDELARVVASVEENEDGRTGDLTRKVKLESRKGGHELLGRALGLYRDRIEHEGKLTLEELVGGSMGSDGSHKGHTRHATPGSTASDSGPNPRSPSKP